MKNRVLRIYLSMKIRAFIMRGCEATQFDDLIQVYQK